MFFDDGNCICESVKDYWSQQVSVALGTLSLKAPTSQKMRLQVSGALQGTEFST